MTKLQTLTLTDAMLDKAVKIQGTKYDRKRKLSESVIKKMCGMSKKGDTVSQIAKKLGLNYSTVRYNVDPVYREEYNAKRNGAHTGKDKISVLNRISYKRSLVAAGKVTA